MYIFRALLLPFILVLSACTEPSYAPILSTATGQSIPENVFVVTNRAKGSDGWFTDERAVGSAHMLVPVNFPPNYQPGDKATVKKVPNPEEDVWVSPKTDLERAVFRQELRRDLDKRASGKREITVYVHGFYNSFFNGVFRSAQLKRDFNLPGTMVHFSWPSRGSNTAYAHDRESVLYSRDAMEALLRDVTSVGATRVNIIAHSLGAFLIMETLRQIEIAEPGWSYRNLDGVAFVAPDIDVEVFKSQAARIDRLPEDFAIFVSNKDKVLLLSSRINGVKPRLGAISDVEITTEGDLTIVDVSALTRSARSEHFIPATSPAAIQLMRNSNAFVDFFPREGLGTLVAGNVRLLQIGQ